MSDPRKLLYQTPSPPLQKRRTSPSSSSRRPPASTKILYLIRHGQSMAQLVKGPARLKDSSLMDSGLTKLGVEQALQLQQSLAHKEIELVVSSPLTRALHTALLAFPDKPILVHYDLREVGDPAIPENQPRNMKTVLKELHVLLVNKSSINTSNVDVTTLQPHDWPRRHDASPKVVRRDRVRSVFADYIASRPERVIAVVAHFNVIRAALSDPWSATATKTTAQIVPQNAIPIVCELGLDGVVRVVQEGHCAAVPMDIVSP